jgi:hypothetical protein
LLGVSGDGDVFAFGIVFLVVFIELIELIGFIACIEPVFAGMGNGVELPAERDELLSDCAFAASAVPARSVAAARVATKNFFMPRIIPTTHDSKHGPPR